MNPVFLLTADDLTKYESQIRLAIRKAASKGSWCNSDAIFERLKMETGAAGGPGGMISLGMTSGTDKSTLIAFVIVEIISDTVGTPFAYLHSAWSGTAFSLSKQAAFFKIIEETARSSGLKGMVLMSERDPKVYERWLKPVGFKKSATVFRKEF